MREDERERDGPADQLRGHRAVERHGRGGRHDRDRERDRLPEAQLAAQPAGLLGVARLALRSHRLHLRSLGAAPTQRRWRRKPPRGASRGRPWPAPATTTSAPRGSAVARRRPSAMNFASRSPRPGRARASSSSPRRPHSGAIAPVPTPRSTAARRAGRCAAGPRARARGRRGGVPANSGCAVQRSANCLDAVAPRRTRRAPRRRRGAPRARRRRRCPAVVATSTQARRRARAPRARRAARCGRPSSSRRARSARARAASTSATQASKLIGRASRRGAVAAAGRAPAADSVRGSSRATTGSQARPVPAKPCSRTTVGGHRARIYDRRRPTPTCCCAPSSTSWRAAACRRVHLAGLALDAARAHAGARAAACDAGRTSTSARAASSRSALAKATGRPAAVACTSGTAAAHYLPAVIEAHEARVPLLVLTADRPPELRDVGAGQTIDQLKLYGGAAKWFFEVGTHAATPERLRWMRPLACRAYWTAVDGRPGPVHLNFPLREPLVLDAPLPARTGGGRARRPAVGRAARAPAPPAIDARRAGERAAASSSPGATSATTASARRWPRRRARARRRRCWPTRSPARAAGRRPSRTTTRCCATRRFAAAHRPGPSCCASATCRPPSRCASGSPASRRRQVAFDPEGAWQDPAGRRRRGPRRRPRRAGRARSPAAARPTAWLDGVARAPTPRPRRRIAAALRRRAQRAAAWRARSARAAARGHRLHRVLDAGARRRDASGRCATRRRACWPTAAPTASTARSPRPSAPPPPARRVVVHLGDVALAHDLGAPAAAPRGWSSRSRSCSSTTPAAGSSTSSRSPRRPTPSRSTSPRRPGLDAERVAALFGLDLRARGRPRARSARPPVRCCTSAPTAPRTSPCTVACTRRSPSGSPASFGRP